MVTSWRPYVIYIESLRTRTTPIGPLFQWPGRMVQTDLLLPVKSVVFLWAKGQKPGIRTSNSWLGANPSHGALIHRVLVQIWWCWEWKFSSLLISSCAQQATHYHNEDPAGYVPNTSVKTPSWCFIALASAKLRAQFKIPKSDLMILGCNSHYEIGDFCLPPQ